MEVSCEIKNYRREHLRKKQYVNLKQQMPIIYIIKVKEIHIVGHPIVRLVQECIGTSRVPRQFYS